jgi:asparagine synthase (glutamine-hydrolysing)
MCGIAGLLSGDRAQPSLVSRMAAALAHRGPDDEGIWVDTDAGVALGHRRLAVVETSVAGHQPMHSADGRFVLSFNGEIYNHRDLRRQFERDHGPRNWRGGSDTETFIEGIAQWGLDETLGRSVGMYAFALWDRRHRRLDLVRDRFGEKPLYYGWVAGAFAFASELKALRQIPGFDNGVSRHALSLFAARTYIPAPLSIYERIFKLPAAAVLTVSPNAALIPRRSPPVEGSSEEGLNLRRYWSYRDAVEHGQAHPIRDEREALERVESALVQAIAGQSIADVPIGAFLSGGIDSSLLVALHQKHWSQPVRTFSIGFEEAGFDEARHARAVARHLGTVHSEHYVTVREAQEVIPRLPAIYDEPFADSSQIPTHLVSKFAREQVTVAISGDGGDELFGGYNRYLAAPRLWKLMRWVPAPLRAAVGRSLGVLPPEFWNRLIRLGGTGAPAHLGGKVRKGLQVAAQSRSIDDLFATFLDEWAGEPSPVLGASGQNGFDMDVAGTATARMMYADAMAYLPDDIMVKVDRAAMAVALETRAPYLDHRVAEAAAALPLGMKIRGARGKLILRRLLARELPPHLVEHPKTGFAIPVSEWIRGPLRAWAEELLDPRGMAQDGWLDAPRIQRRWQDHLNRTRDSGTALWAILMFQAWLKEQQGALAAAA